VEVTLAVTPVARARGLLGRRSPRPLLLAPARAVHTCGMRFAIDAVFLDADLRAVRVVRGLRPWRFAAARGARAVLELAAGGADGIVPGDRLALRPARRRGSRPGPA
jgi:uncharacterized membrane protein (UPF0127 family)